MAGLGGKNWTFQEEVTSSDVNGYLADQVVMRFADSTARTAGFGGSGEPTLAEGMISYLDDANRVDYYNGSAWKPVSQVLQVLSVAKTDTFSTASTTFTDVTGLTQAITPSSTSSKILLIAHVNISIADTSNLQAAYLRFSGGNSTSYVGDTASNRIRAAAQTFEWSGAQRGFGQCHSVIISYLDSPATVASTTYAVQMRIGASTTGWVNRSGWDTDNSGYGRFASSLTVMEIAG